MSTLCAKAFDFVCSDSAAAGYASSRGHGAYAHTCADAFNSRMRAAGLVTQASCQALVSGHDVMGMMSLRQTVQHYYHHL